MNIEIREMERVVIKINEGRESVLVAGYLSVGNDLRSLPIGSTLDMDRGIFYWHPGPGFLGEYRLVFVEKRFTGKTVKRKITIIITPRRVGLGSG